MGDPYFQTVRGACLTPTERNYLVTVAAEAALRSNGHPPVIVNIGVLWGASLHCLRAGAPTARLVGIDIDMESEPVWGDPGAEYVVGDSHLVHVGFAGDIDLLFVDGDHCEEGVVADIEGWAPKVAIGGCVVFHDYDPPGWALEKYADLPGVRAAVDKWAATVGEAWERLPAVDSMAIFVRLE